MTTKIGVNGFGRTGRQVFKAILERHPEALEVVAIYDLTDVETNAHLLTYDSYGRFPGEVALDSSAIVVDGRRIQVLAVPDRGSIAWHDLGVELVVESTGRFTDAVKAAEHLRGGARRVIISAPAKHEAQTIVLERALAAGANRSDTAGVHRDKAVYKDRWWTDDA